MIAFSKMLQVFMDKGFIPVLASTLTVLVILLLRPSVFVRSSADKNCPYCLSPLLVTLVTLLVGGVAYYMVNNGVTSPRVGVYQS